MKSVLTTLVVLALLIGAAVATNPSAERHRERIRAAIADRSPIAGLLGLGAVTAFVSTYHDLGVASYTRVQDRVVSVGAFGAVFLVE